MEARSASRRLSANHRDGNPHQANEQNNSQNGFANPRVARPGRRSFPAALAAFKVSATCLGTGLLWRLKHYHGAQVASWWLCMILTLVTVRWVTVQSLFFVTVDVSTAHKSRRDNHLSRLRERSASQGRERVAYSEDR